MPSVLIIAGGNISRKLPHLRVGCTCPALIPLNTRPLASYVFEAYGPEADLHLFVDESFIGEVSLELPPRKYGYHLHGVSPGNGVVDTLRQALLQMDDSDEVIVNLVTTIPTDIPSTGQIQVANQPAHTTTEWSAIRSDGEELIFYAKGENRPNDALAFTGVFCSPLDRLREAVANTTVNDDLLSVIQAAATATPFQLQTVEWIDCGHETNYYRSRAALINSRSFNRLQVDSKRGTIFKSSENKLKLAREASYLEMLPTGLRILFPRLVAVSGSGEHIDSYEMEYYGYPNLAEYLLYWDLSKESWWRCFDALNDILSLFRKYPASIGPARYQQFHWDKTVSRIDQYLGDLKEDGLARTLMEKSITLNGKSLAPLNELLRSAESVISGSYRETTFSVFHGDFCFNNILFDVASGVMRLIDPRGSFGDDCPGIHGDRRYDLAKLAHSSVGHYDYFVNGLFDVWAPSAGEFRLETVLRPHTPWLAEMTDWLIKEQEQDPREIKVITALLFLSMCPLHQDDSSRQLAFFLRGMCLLDETLL